MTPEQPMPTHAEQESRVAHTQREAAADDAAPAQEECLSATAGTWNRAALNFVIDALMFLVLMAMAGLGFLMKYILLPTREARLHYGQHVHLTWWGWDRHDFGTVHLYLGFLFLGLLSLHLYLHWGQIVRLFHRFVPAERRFLVLMLYVLLALLLVYFPFLLSPEAIPWGRGGGRLRP